MSASTPKRHLRLVSTDPGDYDLAKTVVTKKGGTTSETADVSSILSLILMWPEETKVQIVGQSGDVELNVDRESRDVEFLICTSGNPNHPVQAGDPVSLRVHLFRQLFEFETECLERHAENGGTTLILSVPGAISIRKQRRLPRLPVEALENGSFDALQISNGKTAIAVTPIDVSLDAVGIAIPLTQDSGWTHLRVGNQEVPLLSVRTKDDRWVLFFDKSKPAHYGVIWEMYRKLAFPNIFPRKTYPAEQVIETYEKTGYFGKFETPAAAESRRGQMVRTWQMIQEFEHAFTADYVTAKSAGDEITGASSLTLAFKDEGVPLWVFHQLCAVTSPDILHHSGQLYTWRAEYLAGRPEELEAIVWFDSRSRWLERIYVKFASSSEGVFLKQAAVYRVKEQKNSIVEPAVSEEDLPFNRTLFRSKNLLGGLNPPFLNASHILDCILPRKDSMDSSISDSEILSFGSKFKNGFEYSDLSQKEASNFSSIGNKLDDTDRFCRFNKTSLIDFIASVEHSISVTRKKKRPDKTEVST